MQTKMMRRMLIPLTTVAIVSCGGETRAGAEREDLGGGPGTFVEPEYSRDGQLTFAQLIDGKQAIFVADGDGRGARRVSFGNWDYTPVWSPDGRWIAIGRDANGGDVLIVPADSGAERVVASTPSNDFAIGWMPDGSALLFGTSTPAGNETWSYDVAAGRSERFITIAGSIVGFPSPDQNIIGYVRSERGQTTVWVWDRAANTHKQLTTEGFESTPRSPFSPDGRSLLYVSMRSGTADVWKVDVASGERTQLTRDIGADGLPKWSPDGSRILFESDRGGQPDIWVLSTGESDVQRVTDDALDEVDPTWSRDGRSIVIVGRTGFAHAHVVPLDGSPAVARTAGEFDVFDLSVSADGETIVYSGSKNGDGDIWVVPVAGGEPRLLSAAPGADLSARFSPDGREVVFVSQRGGTADIWIVPVAGGEARRLTSWPSDEFQARWSADGRSILFQSDHESRGTDLWSVPAEGGDPVRLTTLGTIGGVTLSFDGRTLALGAETAASGGIAVFTMSVTGGAPRLLASAHTLFPVWSRDGREIAVQRTADGYGVIEVYSADGRLLRKITVAEKVYEWPVSWTLDGARIVLSFQDIYADGANRLAIQSSTGGARTLLAPGVGLGVRDFALARRADVLVAALVPVGRSLSRVAVP